MQYERLPLYFTRNKTINRNLFSFKGSILSKESLMQLLELLMIKARNILQRALILLSFPALKMGSAMVLLWIDAFTKFTGMNVVFEVSEGNQPMSGRLAANPKICMLNINFPHRKNSPADQKLNQRKPMH